MAILVLPRTLDAAVEKLPDIGPTNAKRLEKLGISTIRDLLLALPFGWQSYGEPTPIASLEEGSPATVVLRLLSSSKKSRSLDVFFPFDRRVPVGPRTLLGLSLARS